MIMKHPRSKKSLDSPRVAHDRSPDHVPSHMELCHGWGHIPFRFPVSSRVTPEQIREQCTRVMSPFWLRVEQTLIPVVGEECLWLACQVSAAYHDWIAYNAPEDDGFEADMEARESRVALHMEEPSSEESETDVDEGV